VSTTKVGSKGAFRIGEAKLDENNYLVVEIYTPSKGKDEGRDVLNIRVFTRKLYSVENRQKVYLPEAEVRDDPTWIPASGFMIREGQAREVLPQLVEAIEKAMKIWGVEIPTKGKGGTKR
jgi:hypothetical protein